MGADMIAKQATREAGTKLPSASTARPQPPGTHLDGYVITWPRFQLAKRGRLSPSSSANPVSGLCLFCSGARLKVLRAAMVTRGACCDGAVPFCAHWEAICMRVPIKFVFSTLRTMLWQHQAAEL